MNEVTVSIRVGDAKLVVIGNDRVVQLQIHHDSTMAAIDLDLPHAEMFKYLLGNFIMGLERGRYARECEAQAEGWGAAGAVKVKTGDTDADTTSV